MSGDTNLVGFTIVEEFTLGSYYLEFERSLLLGDTLWARASTYRDTDTSTDVNFALGIEGCEGEELTSTEVTFKVKLLPCRVKPEQGSLKL